jgi:uncharacterized membrane protein
MGKRFDTNPLDPEFPERSRREQETTVLPEDVPETHPLFEVAPTEEVTRTLVEEDLRRGGFSEHIPPDANSYPVRQNGVTNPSRKVDGLLFSERTLTSMVYFPYFGLIVGAVVLLRTSRTEGKLRFHAAQALAAQLAILVISRFLNFADQELAGMLFDAITTIMLLIFVFKAWKDRPIHVEAIEPLTDWLESKISRDTKWS